MGDHNTGSGILTGDQRQYLRGQSEIEPGSSRERNMRRRIRQRVRNAVLDFGILNRHLDQEDLAQALEVDESYPTRKEPEEMRKELRRVLGFEELEEAILPPEIVDSRPELVVFLYRITGTTARLEAAIEAGVEEIYARQLPDAILEDVDLRIRARLRENLVNVGETRMDQGEALTPSQTLAMLQSEDHTDEEIGEYVRSTAATDE